MAPVLLADEAAAWPVATDAVSMHHHVDHVREPGLDAVRTVLGPGGHR